MMARSMTQPSPIARPGIPFCEIGLALGGGLEAVGPDEHGVAERHVLADTAAHADDAALDRRPLPR